MKYLFFPVAMMLASPLVQADTLPAPYIAEYELLRAGSLAGKATIRLEKGENSAQWRLQSHTRGTQGLAAMIGLEVTETSDFSIQGNTLSCGQYRYLQTGMRKRERSAECGTQGIVSRDRHGEYRFDAKQGVLDRQMVSLALGMDLAAGKRKALRYTVVDREQLDTQKFRVKGQESLTLPAGTLQTIKVEREHANSRRHTTTWFGMDQGWIPVRIVQTDDDGGFELRLVSVRR